MLTKILNKLYEYSNVYLDVITDDKLEMPGFSYIEEDLYGRLKPIVVLNPKLFPRDENVIAHIVSHEWGHHVLKHVFTDPSKLSKEERQIREDEADKYASGFIKEFIYDVEPIVEYFKRHSPDYQDRIKILVNEPENRQEGWS